MPGISFCSIVDYIFNRTSYSYSYKYLIITNIDYLVCDVAKLLTLKLEDNTQGIVLLYMR